ncbi:MAG: hypothetical protein AB7T06_08450 [Kofleriaceae bacterium]
MRCIGVSAILLVSSGVHAQAPDPSPTAAPNAPAPTPEYPIEYVDRPLVMNAGMDNIGLFYARGHALVTTTDAMGKPVTMRSDFGELSSWVVSYDHSFGRLELHAALSNDDTALAVRFAPTRSLLLVARVGGSFGTYPDDDRSRYYIAESVRATYRVVHVPKRFAVFVGGGVVLEQLQGRFFDGTFREGVETSTSAGASAGVQLSRNVSAWLAGSAGALVQSSVGNERDGGVSVESQLRFALRHWDFLVGAGVTDLTDTRRATIFSEIVFRWGP